MVLARSSSSNIHSVSGERNTVGPMRIDGDAGVAPLAAERLGDAVDRRLRRAIGGVAGGMAEQPARRRHQDDFAALPLLEHLPAGRARHQPGLRDVGIHHVEEVLRLLSTIFDTLFWPDATTRMSTRPNFLTAASTIASQLASELGRIGDGLDLGAERLAFGGDLLELVRACRPRSRHWRRRRRAPLPASAPNAPDAPVTIAVLPRMSNRESGFFRKSSDMTMRSSTLLGLAVSPHAGRCATRR